MLRASSVLFCCSIFHATFVSANEINKEFCNIYDGSSEVLSFRLGLSENPDTDARLRLPAEYLDSRFLKRYRNSVLDGALLFRVRHEDFQPPSETELTKGLREKVRPFMRVLATGPKNIPVDVGIFEATGVLSGQDQIAAIVAASEPIEGLAAFKGLARRDLFVIRGEAEPQGYALCMREGLGNPHCDMHINAAGIGLKIAFDRDLLSDWRALRAGVTEFATCMVVKAPG